MKQPKIPEWAKNPVDLLKRFEAAEERKQPWIDHLRTAYQYLLPHRENFYLHSKGDRRTAHIFDSTGPDALEVFANQLQARIMPPWRKFSKLTPGADTPRDRHEKIQEQLDEQTDILFQYLNHSNMATQVNESFLDLGIGTGALTLEYELKDGNLTLIFNAVPQAELVVEEGPNGIIETVWRKRKVKGRNITRTWKGARLGPKLGRKVAARGGENKDFDFVEGVIYDDKQDVYYGVAIEKGTKEMVWQAVYGVSPWIVFRWNVAPGELYGRGPGMKCLPDVLTANKIVEYVLRNAALAVAGAYTSSDSEVINPYTIQIAPGTVIPVRSNARENPTLKALERSGDFSVADLVLSDIRDRIKKAMHNSLRRAEGPVKSATEIAIDNLEQVEQTGASYGRLQTECVAKIIRRAVYILQKHGKMAPIRVNGRDVDLVHTSPLARAQDAEEVMTIQRFTELAAAFGQEITAMGVKVEDFPSYIAKKVGMPAELIRDEGEQKQLTDKIAQMLAQLQAQQQQGAA